MKIKLYIEKPKEAIGWVTKTTNGALAISTSIKDALEYDGEQKAFEDRYKIIKSIGPKALVNFVFDDKEITNGK